MAYACDIAGIVAATASCVSALAAMGAFVAAVWNYRGTHRPDVIAYLEADAKTEYVSFCIGNFGDRTAHDVSMSFSEKIDVEDDEDREHLASFANAGITTLPPGAVKKTAAGCMTDRAYSEGREYVVLQNPRAIPHPSYQHH